MRWTVATALLALGACGGGGTAPAPTPSATLAADGKDYRKEVAALPEQQQHVVLLRAIMDAGQTCQGVDVARRQPDQQGRPVWLARCIGGQDWLVAIQADGTANVTGPIGAKTVPAGQGTGE